MSGAENLQGKTFEELANECFMSLKNSVKISTMGIYSSMLKNHLLPFFGRKIYSEITPETIEDFITSKLESGFSNRHVANSMTVLRVITKYVSEKYRCFDPAINIKSPKFDRKSKKSDYTSEECEQVLRVLFSEINRTKAAVLLALHAGLHVGELCALKSEDIDLETGTVRIEKTIQRVSLEGGTQVLLSELAESKKRCVPIADYLCEILREFKPVQNHYFLSDSNQPIEPRTMQHRLAALFRDTDLDVNFVKLREMFLGRCLEQGINLVAVSQMSGKSFFEVNIAKINRQNRENSQSAVVFV